MIPSMKSDANLAHKLRALQKRIALIEALMTFLKEHPRVAPRTLLRQFPTKVGLYFFDKAIVRPVWVKDKVALRLERYREDWDDNGEGYDPFDENKNTVCTDISILSGPELDQVLKKVKIDLSKTEAEDEEEEEEEEEF